MGSKEMLGTWTDQNTKGTFFRYFFFFFFSVFQKDYLRVSVGAKKNVTKHSVTAFTGQCNLEYHIPCLVQLLMLRNRFLAPLPGKHRHPMTVARAFLAHTHNLFYTDR